MPSVYMVTTISMVPMNIGFSMDTEFSFHKAFEVDEKYLHAFIYHSKVFIQAHIVRGGNLLMKLWTRWRTRECERKCKYRISSHASWDVFKTALGCHPNRKTKPASQVSSEDALRHMQSAHANVQL